MSQVPYDRLTDHEYDGIQEYDNPTPGWWHWLFWLTIAFAFPYFLIYHFGDLGWRIEERHQRDQSAALLAQFKGIVLKGDTATVMKYVGDKEWGVIGESVFKANCVQCHGAEGQGMAGAGVNLTDDVYKNVKTPADIVRVVAEGAANNAMPAWKARLHQNEIVLVASYVAGLRGRNVAGRAPEGEQIPPWPKLEAAPGKP
ncbi:MAG: hypothetical protein AMXMBFR47_16260 [Planctomycetota bacterium]